MELTTTLGRQVTVFGCRRCSEETNDTGPCKAASREFKSGYKSMQSVSPDLPLWGNHVPGSLEYGQAMNEWVSELSRKKGINVNKAYCEAKRQGWQPELYEMEDDLRLELETAGLIPSTPSSQPVVPQEPIDSGISLDEIIKNLRQEGSE